MEPSNQSSLRRHLMIEGRAQQQLCLSERRRVCEQHQSSAEAVAALVQRLASPRYGEDELGPRLGLLGLHTQRLIKISTTQSSPSIGSDLRRRERPGSSRPVFPDEARPAPAMLYVQNLHPGRGQEPAPEQESARPFLQRGSSQDTTRWGGLSNGFRATSRPRRRARSPPHRDDRVPVRVGAGRPRTAARLTGGGWCRAAAAGPVWSLRTSLTASSG